MIARFLFPLLAAAALLPRGAEAQRNTSPLIDGTLAPVSSFPAVALITLDGDTQCTGTLVGPRHILSAAHCFHDGNNQRITDPTRFGAELNGVAYEGSAITIHPSYVSRSAACIPNEPDAAVLTLSSVPGGVAAVPLARVPSPAGTPLLLVGFGTQGSGEGGEDGSLPPAGFVNFGTTTIESNDSTYVNWFMDPGETNTASGDSGGPAFVDVNGGRFINSITCGGTGNAGFGSSSSNTRADRIAAWVDTITGTAPTGVPPRFIALPAQTAGVEVPFAYLVQVVGSLPLTLTANGLPPGLTFDGTRILGVPTTVGRFPVTLAVTNAAGSATGTLIINVVPFDPDGALAVTRVNVSFAEESADLMTIRGTIKLPKQRSFRPRNQRVRLTIAELRDSFTLRSDGTAERPGGFDFVELVGPMRGGRFLGSMARFAIYLGDRESLYDKLDRLLPEGSPLGATAPLPIEIRIGSIVYATTVTMVHRGGDRWRFRASPAGARLVPRVATRRQLRQGGAVTGVLHHPVVQ